MIKTQTLIGVAIGSLAILSSCSKKENETYDFVCSCNYQPNIFIPGGKTHYINEATLEEAKDECEEIGSAYTTMAGRYIYCGLSVK